MVKPRSIAIVRLSALGDVVHGLPLACRLRDGLPGLELGWVVGPAAAALVSDHAAVDWVVTADKRKPFDLVRAVHNLRDRKVDVVIDLQALFASGLLVWLSGARRRLGFDRARMREGSYLFTNETLATQSPHSHVVDQNLAFADAVGCPPTPSRFGLAVSTTAATWARAQLGPRPYVGLVIGAGKPANRLPIAQLSTLLRRLREVGVRVVLIGGRAEYWLGRYLAALYPWVVNTVGALSIRQLLAVVAQAEVVLGGDTGAVHMAAALDTPVVTWFGGANQVRTGPRGDEATVVTSHWWCSPCYQRRCPWDRACLRALSMEHIAEQVVACARHA